MCTSKIEIRETKPDISRLIRFALSTEQQLNDNGPFLLKGEHRKNIFPFHYWRPLNYKFLNFRRLALWNKEGGNVVSRLIAPSARHSQVGVVIFTRHELRFQCSKRVIIVFTLGPHGVDLHG
ncbi:hypothetical protein NPIL_546881 [Nephila pilipes]|uniref:Uncharacterized protein n=1 Tax=Nephila pilipes TaxID=299642 RepID=A0A8X6UQP4_NEPPI|nr:hypothetical protein NPIL_546881 [Nephila pilipes]